MRAVCWRLPLLSSTTSAATQYQASRGTQQRVLQMLRGSTNLQHGKIINKPSGSLETVAVKCPLQKFLVVTQVLLSILNLPSDLHAANSAGRTVGFSASLFLKWSLCSSCRWQQRLNLPGWVGLS
ncbi:hypothetical protein HDK90DRAFT_136695 [Phyllosticta capitalensis]|uniref:Secreted protein n=1 Tax=Phyllosticta capitalensis TaxID=121624 RepID=A0ABR1YYV5_9PEZI